MSAIPSTTRIRWSGRWVRWLVTWPNRVVAYWRRRGMTKMLHELSDHQLCDIGIQRDQIEAAVSGIADADVMRLWGGATTCEKRRPSR